MFKIKVCILYLFILLSGCSAANKSALPGWVLDKNKSDYSKDYILAVGYGVDIIEAGNNAREQISEFFNSSISSQAIYSSTEYNYGSNTKLNNYYISDISVKSSIDDLVSLETLESYIDSRGNVYILLGMNKRLSLSYYQDKLNNILYLIIDDYSYLEKEQSKLKKLEILARIENNIEQFLLLKNMIFMIDSNVKTHTTFSIDEIEKLRNEIKDNFIFRLEIKDSFDDSIDNTILSVLSKIITKQGFSVSLSDGDAIISVSYQITELDNKSSNYYCTYSIEIEIKNLNNEIFYSWGKSGREAMKSSQLAKEKSLYMLVKSLETEFEKNINDIF
ncbi:MAG: LPP20 family lipoprotein [Sphaerochaetaceae bacterium]|nr:LPP20 family lipoprotein [Sphaerochaetaceae bacterium]MCF0261923.1 LPP20 family lipoprotein [Sphaerochaetaceae bacterium]